MRQRSAKASPDCRRLQGNARLGRALPGEHPAALGMGHGHLALSAHLLGRVAVGRAFAHGQHLLAELHLLSGRRRTRGRAAPRQRHSRGAGGDQKSHIGISVRISSRVCSFDRYHGPGARPGFPSRPPPAAQRAPTEHARRPRIDQLSLRGGIWGHLRCRRPRLGLPATLVVVAPPQTRGKHPQAAGDSTQSRRGAP